MSIKPLPDGTVGEQVIVLDSTGNQVFTSLTPVGNHVHVADLSVKQNLVKPAGATALMCQNTGTGKIRWTVDGTDPAAALGFQLHSGADAMLINCPGVAIEMIQEAAGAMLDYQWVK